MQQSHSKITEIWVIDTPTIDTPVTAPLTGWFTFTYTHFGAFGAGAAGFAERVPDATCMMKPLQRV